MNMTKLRAILSAASLCFIGSAPVSAQLGVDEGVLVPFPETGMWNSLDGSGTGIILEVQAGTMVGALFGADASGDNTWLLFSGEVAPRISEEFGTPVQIGWTLETTLFRTTGSGCVVECPPGENLAAPVTTEAGQITLQFTGRASATYRIDDGDAKQIAPFYFGVVARRFDTTNPLAKMPDLTGTWVYASQHPDSGLIDPPPEIPVGHGVAIIQPPTVIRVPTAAGIEVLETIVFPVEFEGPDAELTCQFGLGAEQPEGLPRCFLDLEESDVPTIEIEFHDLTDSRFTLFQGGDVPGGTTRTDFFRVGYD